MILLNQTPPGVGRILDPLYRRMPAEGLVHSAVMRGEIYEMSDSYRDDWACPAITWSAGGEERYRFKNGKPIILKSAGALALGIGDRYEYTAHPGMRFFSNMIVFPRWITKGAAASAIDGDPCAERALATRLFRPDPAQESLMNEIAMRCRRGCMDYDLYKEQMAILYDMLIRGQDDSIAACDAFLAAKSSTRAELARRVRRAQHYMLLNYGEARLSLKLIAREACLSQFHLIRTFKALTGLTPMQYLTAARMDAALRLLRSTKMAIAEIARAVGYCDRTAFFRAFRKHYGRSPSAAERPYFRH